MNRIVEYSAKKKMKEFSNKWSFIYFC